MTPTKPTAVLAQCPFCGGEASHGTIRYSDVTIREQGWNQDTFHYVNCIVCGSNNRGLVGFDSEAKAEEHWNRRAVLAQPDTGEVAALIEHGLLPPNVIAELISFVRSYANAGHDKSAVTLLAKCERLTSDDSGAVSVLTLIEELQTCARTWNEPNDADLCGRAAMMLARLSAPQRERDLTDDEIVNAVYKADAVSDGVTRINEMRGNEWHATTIFDGDAALFTFARSLGAA
jgi:hypothetical protein